MEPRSLVMGRASRQAPSGAAWALLPEEIESLTPGYSGDSIFSALHRPWRWGQSGPLLSPRVLEGLGALVLPVVRERRRSIDGATKLLLEFPRGSIECVHMPRDVGAGRVTLCLSSQIGCAMACSFCATAKMGLIAQLSAAEIVAQVLVSLRELGPRQPGDLTLVFMGMGEPLHNWRELARALRVLQHPRGLGLSPRRMTVSTVGLVPQIDELARWAHRPHLAVSVNATTDTLRRQLMPITRRYGLGELQAALARFPLRSGERILIEYVLLAGVNDSPEAALQLSDFCAPFSHHINLIPYNAPDAAIEGSAAGFAAPGEARIEAFARALLGRRRTLLTVRRSRGGDVSAACGQLARMAAGTSHC